MLSSVASTSFLSWRLAPSTASPTGTPLASVNRLRFAPCLPRSVGVLPVRSPPSGALPGPLPPERGLGRPPVHRQPLPIEPHQRVVLLEALGPEGDEHAG